MRDMKLSGKDWILEIPANWNIQPIRSLFSEVTEKNKLGLVTKSLKFTYGEIIPKNDFDTDDEYVAKTILNYTVVLPGTIMLNGLNLNFDFVSQRVGLVREKGVITSAYTAFRPSSEEVLSEYATYMFKAYDTKKAFHNMGGGVRKILNFSELKRYYFPYPNKSEQEKIVRFLDDKCKRIELLKSDIQSQIEIIENYKKSLISECVTRGIDKHSTVIKSRIYYMGPYNKEWKLTKIGYICTKLARTFKAEDMPVVCSNSGKVLPRDEKATGKMVSEDNAMQGIKKGDIAIHGMDTWHGAIALSELDGKITRVVHVCDSSVDKRFIVYYLQHLAFQGVYKLISNGVRGNTSDFRSWDKVRDIYIAVPKNDREQNEICDYLDGACKKTEDIVEKKKTQLFILENLKRSLIYDYVTGKKEVPADV